MGRSRHTEAQIIAALKQVLHGDEVDGVTGHDGNDNDRPNQVEISYLSSGRSWSAKIAQYFNTAAFVQVLAGTPYGNVGRNSLIGPGYDNVDLSAFKNIPLWHEHNLQFRGEFFNFFNHVNLGNPNGTRTSTKFGTISSAGSPRILQVALRYSF